MKLDFLKRKKVENNDSNFVKAKKIHEKQLKKERDRLKNRKEDGFFKNLIRTLKIVAITNTYTTIGTSISVGLLACGISLITLFSVFVANGLVMSSKIAYYVMAASIGVNVVLLAWMFMNKAYRYFWTNIMKIYRYTAQGAPFLFALVLYKNQSCLWTILKVENGKCTHQNKIYHLKQKGLFRDLQGGWMVGIIEEDNAEIKTFFDAEAPISAEAWQIYGLKVKALEETKAYRNKQILLMAIIVVGIGVCVVGYMVYQFQHGYTDAVRTACYSVAKNAYQCAMNVTTQYPPGAGQL